MPARSGHGLPRHRALHDGGRTINRQRGHSNWNGSTWAAGPGAFQPAAFTDATHWQFTGTQCPTNCWVRGDQYVARFRATDNAGNLQTVVSAGPKFQIAADAVSFLLSSVPTSTAGADINLTVEAKDGANGGGARHRLYKTVSTSTACRAARRSWTMTASPTT